MNKEEAIKILQRMSNDIYFGGYVHEAMRMGAEALKKQKPVECGSDDEKIRKEIYNFLIDMDCKREWIAYLEKQKEQKPVEYFNKKKVYSIISKLTNLAYSTLISIGSDEYNKINEITGDVRSLLDYPIEKNPAECGDEEITKIRSEEYTKGFNDAAFGGKAWKPSKELTDAMLGAIGFMKTHNASDYDVRPLKSLYEQLKKLM